MIINVPGDIDSVQVSELRAATERHVSGHRMQLTPLHSAAGLLHGEVAAPALAAGVDYYSYEYNNKKLSRNS